MPLRLSTEDFIKKAKIKHKNKFDYSKVKYINSHSKVKIKCSKHGFFFQTPNSHLSTKYACKICAENGVILKNRRSKADFIKEAKKVHGNRYIYKNVDYQGSQKKISIICRKHGPFLTLPSVHLDGRNCNKCSTEIGARKISLSTNSFIKQAKAFHGNKYDYSEVKYKNQRTKVTIICPKHGKFKAVPTAHLRSDCYKCGLEKIGNLKRKSQKNLINDFKKVHGEKYDYTNVKYQSNKHKIEIICPIHGPFKQVPSKHLIGQGCNRCHNKAEGRIAEYLMKKNEIFRQYKISNNGITRFYDFYLPKHKLIIERDGEQHYKDCFFGANDKNYLKKQQNNDAIKTNLVKIKGLKIARLPYWLTPKEERIEIDNILLGNPTYPEVPDVKQVKTKPKPENYKNFCS
ncbi:endonuclease domain-containing protein [SAR86 cluster bacterium]|nr:endonuclease domain-containing protein [SAR86 cluster bacterium]